MPLRSCPGYFVRAKLTARRAGTQGRIGNTEEISHTCGHEWECSTPSRSVRVDSSPFCHGQQTTTKRSPLARPKADLVAIVAGDRPGKRSCRTSSRSHPTEHPGFVSRSRILSTLLPGRRDTRMAAARSPILAAFHRDGPCREHYPATPALMIDQCVRPDIGGSCSRSLSQRKWTSAELISSCPASSSNYPKECTTSEDRSAIRTQNDFRPSAVSERGHYRILQGSDPGQWRASLQYRHRPTGRSRSGRQGRPAH